MVSAARSDIHRSMASLKMKCKALIVQYSSRSRNASQNIQSDVTHNMQSEALFTSVKHWPKSSNTFCLCFLNLYGMCRSKLYSIRAKVVVIKY